MARGLTPLDVVNAVNTQNLTLPSGTAKIGDTQYVVRTNATPSTIDELNDIPIKVVNGATVFVKDVGQVHDGWLVQQNIVRQDGKHSVLLSIIKNGNASTLDVVNRRQAGARRRSASPRRPAWRSTSCSTSRCSCATRCTGVLREGAIAAALTAVMILLFLGSWRSTLVVMISIPLSILTSLVALYFLGETINTMTLGGLALAIGILVDDSTVTIENTHRLLTEERHAPAAGDAARRGRHRHPDPGLDARHQLRVHLGRVPRRAGQVPVHAARPRGRVRDAGLLRPVADARRRSPSACCSRARRMPTTGATRPASVRPPPGALRAPASSACVGSYVGAARRR